jgi:hypothetical protein
LQAANPSDLRHLGLPLFGHITSNPPNNGVTISLLAKISPTGTSPGVPVFPSDTSKPTRKDIKMKTLIKYTAAAVLTGAIALAVATPSEARNGRNAAAIGFGVGAVAGAAIAGSAYNGGYYGYYGYYGEPAYGYSPGYAYSPEYAYDSYGYDSYAYAPAPRYRYYPRWQDEHSTNNFSIDSQR